MPFSRFPLASSLLISIDLVTYFGLYTIILFSDHALFFSLLLALLALFFLPSAFVVWRNVRFNRAFDVPRHCCNYIARSSDREFSFFFFLPFSSSSLAFSFFFSETNTKASMLHTRVA